MKKKISKKGKLNRLIIVGISLLIIGFGSIQLTPKNKAKEMTKLTDIIVNSPTTKTLPEYSSAQLDVPLIDQMDEPSLFNGCEVTSLAMMLNYAGVEVTKNELAESISTVSYIDANGMYGDPNDGFVGDIYGNDNGYSVYHTPIYELAKDYVTTKQEVVDLSNEDFDQILQQLLAENPVWVITTVPMTATNDMEEWQTTNSTISISWNVHSVLITGFDSESIYVNDPYGDKDKKVDRDDFQEAWIQMGSQAVVIQSN